MRFFAWMLFWVIVAGLLLGLVVSFEWAWRITTTLLLLAILEKFATLSITELRFGSRPGDEDGETD